MMIFTESQASAFVALREAIAASRSAGHVVEEAKGRSGVYRVDDRPEPATREVIALADRSRLMGGERGRGS